MTIRPLSPLILRRSFASTIQPQSPSRSRSRTYDVMAKYRRPVLPPLPLLPKVNARDAIFETASTVPASSSIQEVPPPDTTPGQGVRKATPLPAMQPLVSPVTKVLKEEEKEIVVEGVVIPPKPRPPTDEECCMSGCVHCVYNIYADDLEVYTESLESARKALMAANKPEYTWPAPVRRVDKKGSGGIQKEEKGKVADGMDPVMVAFLAMENKLKKKQVASKGSTAGAG